MNIDETACGRNGCPVAAGHCGKLAASLIVIHNPSSVSIKGGKDDTFGGTCSSEYVCMRRRRESENVCVCVLLRTSRATRPLCCHGNLHNQSAGGRGPGSQRALWNEDEKRNELRTQGDIRLTETPSVRPFICSTPGFNETGKKVYILLKKGWETNWF